MQSLAVECEGTGVKINHLINGKSVASRTYFETVNPSTQEVLAGLVERVTHHNDENGFCVLRAKARGHRDLVTVVGHAASYRGR